MIPQPTEADLRRDAESDYSREDTRDRFEREWIRRAVAAESALVAERSAREAAECEWQALQKAHDLLNKGFESACEQMDGLKQQARQATYLQAKLDASEAGAAAMRQTLEAVAEWCECCTCANAGSCVFCQCIKAIATEAGRDLLKRLEAAETENERLRAALKSAVSAWRAKEGA